MLIRGEEVEDKEKIKDEAIKFFSGLYAKEIRSSLILIIFSQGV